MNPRVARPSPALPLVVLIAGLALGLARPAPARADTPPPPPASKAIAKPPAKVGPARAVDAIIADNINAMGGAETMRKHHSLRTKMTITFQGLGIKGTAEHLAAEGDRALTITNIPSVASTREGSDGTRSWAQDPINGLRILTDVEAEQARIEAAWNGELRLKELFTKIEATNDVGSDGAAVECLVLTPKLGSATTRCFDAKTHLGVSERGVRAGPQGQTPFVARVKDWRPVGDVKMPFLTEMQVGPLSFVGTVTSAELDGVIDPGAFAVPEPSGGAGGSNGKAGAAGKAAGVKKPRAGKLEVKAEGAPKGPAKAGDSTPGR